MKTISDLILAGELTADDKFLTLAADGTHDVKELKAVDGIAYSGGQVGQSWAGSPIVVSLAGMEFCEQTPLLYNHYNAPAARLGELTPSVDANMLKVKGGIDPDVDASKTILKAGQKVKWQLSIGASIKKIKFFDKGESFQANGRSFDGPAYLVEQSKLREVSVVAVGADANTHLNIAASLNLSASTKKEGKTMNKGLMMYIAAKYNLGDAADEAAITAKLAEVGRTADQEQVEMKAVEAEKQRVRAIAAAESQRIDGIRAACGDFTELRDEAITAEWSVEQTKKAVAAIEASMKKRQPAGGALIVKSGPDITAGSVEAALCASYGIKGAAVETGSEKDLETASKHLRGLTLRGAIELCAKMENISTGMTFGDDTIRAGFSTTSLPNLLSNVANKRALAAFQAQPVIAPKLCTRADLNDFKEHERVRLVDVGDLEPVAPSGEIKHGGASEDKAGNKLATYAKMFTLTRQMIYNDDLGEFLKVPNAMGQRGARKIDQVFFSRLLSNPVQSDTKALFHVDHKNIFTTSASALGLDGIKAAVAKFAAFVDSDGQPINVEPAFLLVPPELHGLALELTLASALVGGSTKAPALNIVNRFGLEVVRSPYLSNANYTGHSAKGWYLFGSPSQVDTFEIGYFQGRETPTVEQSDTDFNTLGMSFRVYFDFGIREQGAVGMLFAAGE